MILVGLALTVTGVGAFFGIPLLLAGGILAVWGANVQRRPPPGPSDTP